MHNPGIFGSSKFWYWYPILTLASVSVWAENSRLGCRWQPTGKVGIGYLMGSAADVKSIVNLTANLTIESVLASVPDSPWHQIVVELALVGHQISQGYKCTILNFFFFFFFLAGL
jgi:hypothetical protein